MTETDPQTERMETTPNASIAPETHTDEQRSVRWYLAGGVLVTLFGIVATVVFSIPGVIVGIDTLVGFTLSIFLGEVGYAAAGVVFVVVTGRGLGYFDLTVPESWRAVVVVTVGAFVFRTVAVVGSVTLGLEPSPPSVVGVDLPTETLLTVLIVASVLVIGPAEELLFRGAIQKYLHERLSARAAIVGAGILFASIHLPTLVVATTAGVGISIGIILVVGLALGWLYEQTGSLVAAMVAHSAYNALIFGSAAVVTVLL